MVVVFRDESERRRAEVALQDADRRKDEFLATLAHELRNPLAPICTGLELLKMSADDPQASEEVREMMQRQTRHMVRLIDDLMDISRITRGKIELKKQQVELAEIVRDAVAATRPLVQAGKHQLKVDLPRQPVFLFADESRLTQVITNLLNNAIKYTPREGQIELAADCTADDVILRVTDSGVGIPADKLDSVFDMFAQIQQDHESGHTGLGIGLSLVKSLVEMHGGSVTVTSRGRNLGTTFLLRLPRASAAPVVGPATPDASNGHAPDKCRVLVVDDNVDALKSLSRMVELLGSEVRRAHDGLQAIEMAREFKPDIVLMDIGMPRLNGYDAARRIRQEPWGQELTLIATTGWGQDADRQRTADAGFDQHLVKPIDLSKLREVLAAPRTGEEATQSFADATPRY
jgi:CheY-like chemotaxis protein/two-component sensor histidine kinase